MKKSWLTVLSAIFVLALISNPSPALAGVDDGAKLYKKRCAACHPTEVGKHKKGPSLAGIFGRQAGTTDFAKYMARSSSRVTLFQAT